MAYRYARHRRSIERLAEAQLPTEVLVRGVSIDCRLLQKKQAGDKPRRSFKPSCRRVALRIREAIKWFSREECYLRSARFGLRPLGKFFGGIAPLGG